MLHISSIGIALAAVFFHSALAQTLKSDNPVTTPKLEVSVSLTKARFMSKAKRMSGSMFYGCARCRGAQGGISWIHRWARNRGLEMSIRDEPEPPKFNWDLTQ